MVVDGCRFLVERVVRVLEARGYACVVASDGYQALSLAGSRRCDLFVLAVELAVVDGFSVLRRLREDPGTAGVPVVMLAADLDDLEHDRQHALALGASAYLSKPLQLRSLNQALDVLLRL